MNDSNDTKIAVLQNQMDNIERKVDAGFESLEKKIDELSGQYASKWVERVVAGAMSVIGVGFIGALVYIVFHYKP